MGFFGKSKAPPTGMGSGVHHGIGHYAPQTAFRGMTSPGISPFPMGHVPPAFKQQCTIALKAALKDLSNLKRVGILNPNFMMTEKWLQVLST